MFGCILGARSFDSPGRPLARKQAFFSITFGDVRLILTSTIAPTTYLGVTTLTLGLQPRQGLARLQAKRGNSRVKESVKE
jgi:hypothetical protein